MGKSILIPEQPVPAKELVVASVIRHPGQEATVTLGLKGAEYFADSTYVYKISDEDACKSFDEIIELVLSAHVKEPGAELKAESK